MEHVAQRSFRYNDEFGAEFLAFFEGVRATFTALNGSAVENVQPFEDALAQLTAAWATQQLRDSSRVSTDMEEAWL